MKQGTFMAVAAVLALLFGLAFLLIPAQLMSIYSITLGPDGLWIARCLGSAFIGIAATTWFARQARPSEALRAIMLGDFVVAIIGLIAAVVYAIVGSTNAIIWSTAAIYAFLAVGFGYYRFVRPPGS